MSIRKRGKYWIVDVGKGPTRLRRSAKTAREAREAEARLRRQLATVGSSHGLDAALARYLLEEVPHLKDARGQRSKAKHLLPHLEGRTFDDIPDVCQAVIDSLEGYQPATINRRLALLKRLCSIAYSRWGWLEVPVSQKVKLLPERNQRHVYLTGLQLETLIKNCRQPEADALMLLAYTGMRKGELLGLMAGKGRVEGDCIVLGTDTKSGRPRVIPVAPPALPILSRLPLMLSETTLKQQFEKARVKAGMPHLRIHDLRHTYASWLAQQNVSLGTIGALLGHSQAQTTRRYAHLSVDALREATGRLAVNSTAQSTAQENPE